MNAKPVQLTVFNIRYKRDDQYARMLHGYFSTAVTFTVYTCRTDYFNFRLLHNVGIKAEIN